MPPTLDMIEPLLDALIREHRSSVAEWSGNMGGHVGVREDHFSFDDETPIEDCAECDLILSTQQRLADVPA